MESSHPKTSENRYGIPGDLHLCGRLRFNDVREIQGYFDGREDEARKVLEAEEWCFGSDGKPIKQEALDGMKRIARTMLWRIKDRSETIRKCPLLIAMFKQEELKHG